jgi:hypothetical protein
VAAKLVALQEGFSSTELVGSLFKNTVMFFLHFLYSFLTSFIAATILLL